jgi:hypothetical protein
VCHGAAPPVGGSLLPWSRSRVIRLQPPMR